MIGYHLSEIKNAEAPKETNWNKNSYLKQQSNRPLGVQVGSERRHRDELVSFSSYGAVSIKVIQGGHGVDRFQQ